MTLSNKSSEVIIKKVYIVTGATGFVGNNVVRALEAKGEDVIAMAQNENKAKKVLKGSTAKMIYGDVRDKEAVEKLFCYDKGECQYIVMHTASVVYLEKSRKAVKNMFEININGAKNICELCLQYKARLVYVSSVHAIPEQPNHGLMTEVKEFDPKLVVGRYAKSKASASRMVMEFIQKGLNAVVVHPAGITGPNDFSDTHLLQMAVDYCKGRIPAAVKGGYDFVDVRDVTAGILAAAEKGRTGECYLLSNKYYTSKEMLDILHEFGVGKKIKTVLPMFMAYLGLPFLKLHAKLYKQRPLYSSYMLYTLRSNSNFSHEKAAAELGYNPRSLKDSLKDTLEFMKNEGMV